MTDMKRNVTTITVRVWYLLTLFNNHSVHNSLALLMYVFLWDLVTLLVLLVMALCPMMRVMMNNRRVIRCVMYLSILLLTMSGGSMITLLYLGDVKDEVTLLMFLLLRDVHTPDLYLIITMRTTGITNMPVYSLTLGSRDSAMHKTGGQEEN